MKRRFMRVLRFAMAWTFVSLVMATPAFAQNWDKPFDTDGVNGSSPSNKAYTLGTFTWQWEHCHGECDEKASFSVALHVHGGTKSCGRLKITTYVGSRLTDTGNKVEKRFPGDTKTNFGYFTFCPPTGRGSKTFTGTDIQDRSTLSDSGRFHKAVIDVCWTRNSKTPPGGDCYEFTIRAGGW